MVEEIENAAYQRRLINRLQRVHQQSSGKLISLADYAQKSLGAFPNDVEKVLNQLGIPYAGSVSAANNIPGFRPTQQTSQASTFLADEHPNDFDWRFAPNTIKHLAKRVERYSASNKSVALFGIKTLLPTLIEHGVNVVLYERSTSLIQDFYQNGYTTGCVIQHDLLNPIPLSRSIYDLVFADPPWYLEYYEAYFDRAAELLALNSEFWLSVLPPLTRPSALSDRKAIQKIALGRGFQLKRKMPGLLIYKTPAFERHMLDTNRLNLGDWRPGDLWTFKKMKDTLIAPRHALHLATAAWSEYRIGSKKIQLRKGNEDTHECFDYWPTHPSGKFFHSVSRRATERTQITVWTSDNIAFSVASVNKLIPFLSYLQSGNSLSETIKRVFSVQTLAQTEQLKIVALLNELDLFTE